MGNPEKMSLARSLGAFFGHIAKGVRTDPAAPQTIRRETTTEEPRETPAGKVVLRRTVVEEVIVPNPGANKHR